jgi:hypothetical protein
MIVTRAAQKFAGERKQIQPRDPRSHRKNAKSFWQQIAI